MDVAKTAKWLLKPLFDAVASPGIGNPHTPYEAELMAAGVKPAALMDPAHVTAEMQAAINAGSVVLIGEHILERTHRIYCLPDQVDQAREAARILSDSFQNHTPLTAEDGAAVFDLFGVDADGTRRVFAISTGMPDIQDRLLREQDAPEVDDLLGDRIKALPPFLMHEQIPAARPLEDAVAQGRLGSADIKCTHLCQVFAQSSRQEEGKELFARYYRNGEGYDALPENEGAARVGRLLGYTENDIVWCYGDKYQNPVIEQLMHWTRDLRAWARKESMLMDGLPPSPSPGTRKP